MRLHRKDRASPASEEPGEAVGSDAEVASSSQESLPVPRNGAAPRIGDLLVDQQLVSPSQLAEALLQQSASGKRLGSLLVDLGAINDLELAKVLATHLSLPLANLRQDSPEDDAVEQVPEAIARAHTAIPMRKSDAGLEVAMANPTDAEALDALAKASGMTVIPFVAPPSDIKRTIDQSYRALVAVERHVEAFLAAEALTTQVNVSDDSGSAAPVVQVVNLMVTQGVRDRASDIHIEPQDSRVRIRYRIDGALHDVLALPAEMGPAVVSRIKVLGGMNIVERRRPQDGQFATEIDGRSLDVRVATTTTIWGEKAVLRLLDKSRSLLRLNELGMPAETHTRFSKAIRSPFGMVICAGPTGSGKTTTLYAALAEINQSEKNIMTVEDPVEYVLPSINQIQIHDQAGITFAGGLKAILRQDPDVILVGEMRDVETARIGIQSALTGHFVLTSLHATDAAGALERFLDLDIEPFLIASSVVGVVGQRLVRKICRFCAQPYRPSVEELEFYRGAGGPAKDTFFQGEGCNFCFRTGYEDRVGVYELLTITPEMKKVLMSRANHDEIHALATEQGMRSLRDGGINLAAQDVTTISEVIRSIYSI
ncbi:MAG: type pilus assembly protein PilB [Actinomycetota bacterium]|nr:type pilus assembly protein PilB [Actinomycetota bacterium]